MMKHLYNILLFSVVWASSSVFVDSAFNCPQSCRCEIPGAYPQTLTIRDCSTTPGAEMYDMIKQFQDILKLEIINASLSSIGDLSYLDDMMDLDLSHNKFKSVPCEELSKIPRLSELVLSHNEIETVDCDIGSMVKLTELRLDYNKLTSVPCAQSKMEILSKLYLTHNLIQTADCDMSTMVPLSWLYLDYNKLKSIPCQLSKLSDMFVLSLTHNEIEAVDCDMSPLVGLSFLHLEHNKLTSMPCELTKFPKLSKLQLSHNELQTLDCDMSGLGGSGNLDLHLYLDNNNLTTLPLLTGIPRVNAEMNAISNFTNTAGNNSSCKALPYFDLENNSVTHLMDIVQGWDLPINDTDFWVCVVKITEHFSGNPLACDCVDYPFYRAFLKSGHWWKYPCHSPVSLKGQNPATITYDQFVCSHSSPTTLWTLTILCMSMILLFYHLT